MDKKWVDEHIELNKARYEDEVSNIRVLLHEHTELTDEEIECAIAELNRKVSESFYPSAFDMFFDVIHLRREQYGDDKHAFDNFQDRLITSVDRTDLTEKCRNLFQLFRLQARYDMYLDSECVEFDGDIIITDPCYLMNDDDMRSGYDSIKSWGLSSYMTRDTMCGDWSCNTIDSNTGKVVGEFCADGGEVGVFLLNEVLEHNPKFDYYHKEHNGAMTLIKNFKGTVKFVVKEVRGTYKSTSEYFEEGEEWVDYYVQVVGHGINKCTREPIDFHTSPIGW